MKRLARAIVLAALSVAALAAAPAGAQLNRTAVSATGDDLNSCAPVAPCRTINRAISQTNAGGEVLVRDSAGYGPFTVNRPVTVEAAPGVYAGITATSGYGVYINTAQTPAYRVVLRGLTLEGMGTGGTGIYGFAGALVVENCVINGFDSGIVIGGIPSVTVTDTIVRNGRTAGIIIANAGRHAVLDRVQILSGTPWGFGVQDGATAVVRNSVSSGNGSGFAAISNGVLAIEGSEASRNSIGIYAGATATVRVSNSLVVDNTSSGLRNDPGGTFESWSNNRVRANLADTSGVIATIPQQ